MNFVISCKTLSHPLQRGLLYRLKRNEAKEPHAMNRATNPTGTRGKLPKTMARNRATFTCRSQMQKHASSSSSQVQIARHDDAHRAALRTVLSVVASFTFSVHPVMASDLPAVEPVYFGNGCFWGRQYDFVKTEQQKLGRQPGEITAVVGYAGGRLQSPNGKVCYYYTSDRDSVYERLGHAEVVELELRGVNLQEQASQYRQFAETYFSQFRALPGGAGMLRQDPQDAGPGYRNVVGIPGGINSPLFSVLQEANIHGMKLVEGKGNEFVNGRPTEDDALNTVWVVDSKQLPFYRAEEYHQYHNGLGKGFPESYRKGLKAAAASAGKIGSTGCPEYFFMGS